MSRDEPHYPGSATLEVMQEAANYNRFLERKLSAFAAGAAAVLDFGAGIGQFADCLKARGLTIDCVEPDSAQADCLRSKQFATYHSLADLKQQRYDRIYTINVLEHISDDAQALRQLHGHLSAGGKLFIYVPAFPILYSEFDKSIGHWRRYTRQELMTKATQAGFEVEQVEYVDSLGFFAWLIVKCLPGKPVVNRRMVTLYDRLGFPLSRLLDHLARHFLGKNLLLIAVKM